MKVDVLWQISSLVKEIVKTKLCEKGTLLALCYTRPGRVTILLIYIYVCGCNWFVSFVLVVVMICEIIIMHQLKPCSCDKLLSQTYSSVIQLTWNVLSD